MQVQVREAIIVITEMTTTTHPISQITQHHKTTAIKEEDYGAQSAQDLNLKHTRHSNVEYTKLQKKSDKGCGN